MACTFLYENFKNFIAFLDSYSLSDVAAECSSQDIIRIDNTLKQILRKLNLLTNSNGYSPSSLLHSCEEIKTQIPNSPSDYYTIIDGTGHARHVYCQMEQVCGSSSGWTRVAYLNMSDPTEECPSGFRLYNQNGVRACGRPVTSGGSCLSVRFPSYSISYSQVCGRVYGYEKGSPDTFWRGENSQVNATYGNYICEYNFRYSPVCICGHVAAWIGL